MTISYEQFLKEFLGKYKSNMRFYIRLYIRGKAVTIVLDAVILDLLENEVEYNLIERFDKDDPTLTKTAMIVMNRHIRRLRAA